MKVHVRILSTFLALTALACGEVVPIDDNSVIDGGNNNQIDANTLPEEVTIEVMCNAQDGLYIQFFEQAFACMPEIEIFLGSFPSSEELSKACEGSLNPTWIMATWSLVLPRTSRCAWTSSTTSTV